MWIRDGVFSSILILGLLSLPSQVSGDERIRRNDAKGKSSIIIKGEATGETSARMFPDDGVGTLHDEVLKQDKLRWQGGGAFDSRVEKYFKHLKVLKEGLREFSPTSISKLQPLFDLKACSDETKKHIESFHRQSEPNLIELYSVAELKDVSPNELAKMRLRNFGPSRDSAEAMRKTYAWILFGFPQGQQDAEAINKYLDELQQKIFSGELSLEALLGQEVFAPYVTLLRGLGPERNMTFYLPDVLINEARFRLDRRVTELRPPVCTSDKSFEEVTLKEVDEISESIAKDDEVKHLYRFYLNTKHFGLSGAMVSQPTMEGALSRPVDPLYYCGAEINELHKKGLTLYVKMKVLEALSECGKEAKRTMDQLKLNGVRRHEVKY